MQSEWADLFIRYQKFWGGEPSQEDLDLIYTRKPRPPFREVEHPDGSVQKVWCTFDTEQIDIDVFSPLGADFIQDQLYALTDKCAAAASSPPPSMILKPAIVSVCRWPCSLTLADWQVHTAGNCWRTPLPSLCARVGAPPSASGALASAACSPCGPSSASRVVTSCAQSC